MQEKLARIVASLLQENRKQIWAVASYSRATRKYLRPDTVLLGLAIKSEVGKFIFSNVDLQIIFKKKNDLQVL